MENVMIDNLQESQVDAGRSPECSPNVLPGSSDGDGSLDDDDLAFLERRRLFKLERVKAKRDMPAHDPAWKNLKGRSKRTNFYKHRDADVRLWANLLNAILTAKASMFTISMESHTALIEADELLERKTQGNAYKIVMAFALDPRNNLLEEVHRYSKEGDPKRRARLLRVKNPTIRRHLARMVGGEDKLLDEERRIRAAYEEELDPQDETVATGTKTQVRDASGPLGTHEDSAVARKPPKPPSKNAGPARLIDGMCGYLRDGCEKPWRKHATDPAERAKGMRALVRELLKSFSPNDFDQETFEQMAFCFVTPEPATGADRKKWQGLVNVLLAVAREALKLEVQARGSPP